MKLLVFILSLGLVSGMLFAQGNPTIVPVFEGNILHFGNPSLYETDKVQAEDNGRILTRTLELPEYTEPVKIMATLFVQGAPNRADDYDRAGSIYLSINGMADIEILKFITGFCGGMSYLTEDVSWLAPLLRGECTLKAFIDTWGSPGFQIDFELNYSVAPDSVSSTWANGIFNDQSLIREDISDSTPVVQVYIPPDQDKITLSFFTSGHCTDGRGADEFEPKYNYIYIDDQLIYRVQPWREDCQNFAAQNPCGTYRYPRSGWCPGDIVHPTQLDVTQYLTPGQHTLRFGVEDIRPLDASGRGYWRVSAYLAGWGAVNPAEAIALTGPENLTVPTETKIPFQIELIDAAGQRALMSAADLEIQTDQPGPLFSGDSKNWANPLTLPVKHGLATFQMQSAAVGQFKVFVADPTSGLGVSDTVTITVKEDKFLGRNLAVFGRASADHECDAENSPAQFAIDGSLATKWCAGDGLPDWLQLAFADTLEMDYFIVRHAGAREVPAGDPNVDDHPGMNIADYTIQIKNTGGDWEDVAAMTGNPGTLAGNVTFHQLKDPVRTSEVRLHVTRAGIDAVTRIYEFEIYNTQDASISLQFDGVDDYVNCRNTSSLSITGKAITLEARINMSAWKANVWQECIINKEQNNPDNGYMLRCGKNGTLNFNLGANGWHEINSPEGALKLNTWYHVAGTYDGAMMRLFINGVEVAKSAGTFNIGNATGIMCYLGSSQNYPDRSVNGKIDEVRIWNVARTQTQLQATMYDTLAPAYTDSGLAGYWRFDEGEGQLTFDLTPNDNYGTLGSSRVVDSHDPVWVGKKMVVSVTPTNLRVPDVATLSQNYPNPFNPTTQITYSIPTPGRVSLRIYDLHGREVQTLVNQSQPARVYAVTFDATHLASGVYFYKLEVDQKVVAQRKMILIK